MLSTTKIPAAKHIHFIGIGGAGMGGIAEILLRQGNQISGSDLNQSNMTHHLEKLGINIAFGHTEHNINGADVVVYTSMVSKDNPEFAAAEKAGIPIISRGQMLAEMMKNYYGIAISGTHGKTTTTGLVATLLQDGELDPTFVIGGLLRSAGSNAHFGTSRYFIAEADESDASFLFMSPKIAIITNIDADHLNNYRDFAHLKESFVEFIHRMPEDGLAILCSDDENIQQLLPQFARPYLTYGFRETDDVRAVTYKQDETHCHITVHYRQEPPFEVTVNLPGRHNVLNTLAAIAVAKHCQISNDVIAKSLAKFQGTGRRFQIYGELAVPKGHALVIDDYGHHPREIAATMQAIREAWPHRRFVLAFQPHRYSRTQAIFSDFVNVLSQADQLILCDIYSAGEHPIPGVTGEALCDAISHVSKVAPIYIAKPSDLPNKLAHILKAGDVLLLQGAGDIGKVAPALAVKS